MKKSILLRRIGRRNLFTGILLATFTSSAMSINPTLAKPDFSSSTTIVREHKSLNKFLLADITIKGVVTDIDGEPLPGVTVSIPGTSVGTVTDIDGSYSMSVPENATLVFSFIGFEKQTIAIGSRTILNVTLKENISALEEVVVIGYGTQERKDISTAISSASAEDLKDRPSSNFVQSLQGKMPGVRISNNNSAPGGGSNIVIRGVSSINASNSPLIVIDGFPIKDGYNKTENPLNSINPADIESIEVLKDASSSAIYGTQAANGVILVTTKKGKSGKPSISINATSGIQSMLNKVEVLNRDQFLQMMDESRAAAYVIEDPNFGTNDPEAPLWQWTDSDETRISNWTNYSQYSAGMQDPYQMFYRWITVTDTTKNSPHNTDWQDVISQMGKTNDIQLSASGGTEDITYRISGGYFNQEGIVKSSGYDRFSFRANVDMKVNNYLKLGLMLAPSLENTEVLANTEGGNTRNPFYNALGLPPIWAPTDENGVPHYYGTEATYENPWFWNLDFAVNPLANFQIEDKRRTVKNLATLYTEINLMEGLTFRSEFHTQFRFWERNYFLPNSMPTVSQPFSRSRGINQVTSSFNWNSQNFLTYTKSFNAHSLNTMVGYSVDEASYRSTYINKYDYPTDLIPTLNQGTTIVNAQNDARTNRSSESMIGSFARVIYNYDSKYYFTGSIRRDGSSKFGKDNRWGIFPSMSVAWRASDENFFEPFRAVVNDLKIRGGWGVIGNAGISNYLALSTLNSGAYVFGSGSTLAPSYVDGKVANSTLGWEETTDFSLGTDVELFDSRVMLSVDYFHRLTENMLFNLPLPVVTGFSSFMANAGSMRNRGYEYAISTRNIDGVFTWSTSANLSYYRNRVLDIGKDKRPIINNNGYTAENRPLAGIWGYSNLGAFDDWEDVKTSPIFNPQQALWSKRSNPGTPKAADVNGDGILDSNDQTVIGQNNPSFVWGMTNNFGYKNFDFSVHVNGVQGGDLSMVEFESMLGRGGGRRSMTTEYFNNYWTPYRTDGAYATPTRKSADGSSVSGSLVFKGTYVNIQNVVLGYTLPKEIANRANINNLRVYMSVQNAFFFTKYPGYNPEVNFQGNSALSQGIDRGAYPLARTISLGINLAL
ncbi:TonB-dependent receptor [Cyclobacterium sp. 1_MG-2023]|uniref:SusC/RagA family TonB-linked outer membrane protein n=1 Tax=Cyclobacterium sp. 1_MG-2023 TaxID=3062681 RepID=UPI0026E3405A|nr:TonB-dependent receptor [Cyclobacterium sp. 1_MG-2023]MDO6436172.1 TonB-dependent receptor [Cyclobacterium sp. 1_MG-2023]